MTVKVEDVRAWVDGELDENQASVVESAVSDNNELRLAADAMRASQLPYQEALDSTPIPKIPDTLRNNIAALKVSAVDPAIESSSNLSNNALNSTDVEENRSFKMIGTAASVLLAAGIGFLAGSNSNSNPPVESVQVEQQAQAQPSSADKPLQSPENFARTVAVYQTLYVRDTLLGTDNSPTAVSQLKERLSDQTGMDLQIPDLEGYEFVRAQHLEYGDEPLLQLVYLGAEGVPLALCFMPAGANGEGDSENTKLQAYYGLNTAEWLQNGRRIVMVSDAPEDKLNELSKSARQQWSI